MSTVDVRARQDYADADAMVNIGATQNKDLRVAQGMPPFAEIARRGEGYTVQTTTLFAPLVAIPAVTAILEVHNNSAAKALIVMDFFADQVLATAVVQTFAIYAMVTTTKAIPTLTALVLNSLTGKPLITPTATSEIVTGVGTTVVANGWRPWGDVQPWGLAAATPGNSWSAPVDGKLVVPPGASVCMHVMGALATAASFQCGMTFWLETMSVEA